MLLPGPAAAAPGPVDLTVMYLIHHAFRRDLADLGAAVAATPVTDRAAWVALAERHGTPTTTPGRPWPSGSSPGVSAWGSTCTTRRPRRSRWSSAC